ncbi:S41 family peptidase [Candidatus Saccharibacteria bacterium]|nr:S41 family peptidase [Candidatus Saccharibacteria bacterium]
METKQVWKEKRIKLGNAIIWEAIVAVIALVIGLNIRNMVDVESSSAISDSGVDWSELDEVYTKLSSSYNGDIDIEKAVDGAKSGLVASLGDIYTVYFNEEDSADFYDDLHGNVGSGVGIEMGLRDGYVRVLRTLPDNPARRAGVLAGDIIYKVDGAEVWSKTTEEISKLLRGEEGTEVSLTVVRNGKEKEFTMKREVINNVSEYVEFDGKTAIITVTRFDNDTGLKIQQEVANFADKGINKVILDLRGNGGGYVSAAQDLLALWLDGQKMYVQKSKHYGNVTTATASGRALLKDTKTVVLVNKSTASASEIVAGALQDYGKATILGEKTFGKGVVQNLLNLSNGATLKVTVAEWFTPNDRSINHEGITPDVEVERSFEDINAMRDPQMDKAKAL